MRYRKPYFDYSSEGFYFITINTRRREPYFGNISNKKVELSDIGIIAGKYWLNIKEHFQNVRLWNYIIMPDHIHGIIQILPVNAIKIKKEKSINFNYENFLSKIVSNKFGPLKSNSVPVIINQYKSSVTRWCNKNHKSFFAWQPRYFDRIIRNETELYFFQRYIMNNPMNWEKKRIRK